MIEYKVKNKITPANLNNVRIAGPVSEQMEKFFYHRIYSDYAKSAVYKETEDAFRNQIDDLKIVGLWQGEFWGKWMISACGVARYNNDPELCEFLREAALTLISLARDDGYIGTYRDSKNVLPADPEKARKIVGWDCVWNWNVWCRKYTLWGLCETYLLTEDEKILRGAARFADHLIGELRELGLHLKDVGTFCGLPAGSILKPMLILYRITEDKKYLDFCLCETAFWENTDGAMPNLITNFLEKKPIHEWYDHPESWAKAYEMMSCLEGLIELYRVTGDEKYLTVCKNAHDLIKKHEYNAIYGVTCNDMFMNAREYMNSCTEPCDTIHWMRLCYELFTLTGNSEYIDEIEESFYNPFLAASFEDGKWGARAVRSSGRHMVVHNQAKMLESHCCVNNMPRGYMTFLEASLMTDGDKIYLNTFTEFKGSVRVGGASAALCVGGGYLESGRFTVKTVTERDLILLLRVPYWSRQMTVVIGEKTYTHRGSGYLSIPIGKGETTFSAELDMNARVVDFDGIYAIPEERHYVTSRFVSDYIKDTVVPYAEMPSGARARLLYGPLILARSKKCGNSEEEIFSEKSVAGRKALATVTPMKPNGTRLKFKVRIDSDGETLETVMCDFATGSNEYITNTSKLFSIWI